ncbi:MAG: ABC transporter ATP-binding protein [Clostridia bacterium]|nr:ABC transporter ATP-binding protein [Clostridia bacterium]
MLIANNISKSFNGGKIQVLKDVSLEVADGDFAVILGASGSGKSTFMSVISGLERPDSGSVTYNGQEITSLNDKALTEFRKKHVGFIFQQYYLLPHLSVENNVRLGADLAGNKNYGQIITTVGLQDKLKSKPSELSGGEQQRVCIARALAKEPEILFLDEPTGALDEETGRSVLDYIVRLKRERNFTMIMVTHNQNIAEMADTVIKMNSGKIAEVYKNKTPKSAYEIGW